MSTLFRDNLCTSELAKTLADLSALSRLALTLLDHDAVPCCSAPTGRLLSTAQALWSRSIPIGRGQTVRLLAAPLEGTGTEREFAACAQIVQRSVQEAVELDGLCEEMCTRFEELNLFYELANHTVKLGDPGAVATVILKRLLQIVRADRGSILLASEDRQTLEVIAAIGGPRAASLVGRKLGRSETLCGEIFETGEPLIVQSAQDRPKRPAHPERGYRSDSFACIPLASLPLKVSGQVVGVLNVTDKHGGRPFLSGEVKLLEAVAAQTSLLVQTAKLLQKNKELLMNFARSLSYAIDAKDSYTHGHSLRVTEHALGIAKALQLDPQELEALEIAGLLHDIGKIGCPESILNKKGPLSTGEFAVVKQHPVAGAQMLSDITEMAQIARYIRHHHERFDGKGYPDGLAGEDVPLPARILAIADAYDAITSDRPYRGASSRRAAANEIHRNAGTQFDPKLADLFIHLYGRGRHRARSTALRSKYPGLEGRVRAGERT